MSNFLRILPKIVQNELNFTVLFFKNMIIIIFVYVQCDLRELKNKQQNVTRCRAKPNTSMPGWTTSRPPASIDTHQLCGYNQQKLVAMATSLGGSENYIQMVIYSHSSTNPDNLAKIGSVDFEVA